jgi:hypothetical protein
VLSDGKTGAKITKLRMWDKNAALGHAARHLGLFEKDNAQRDNAPNRVIIEIVGDPPAPRSEQPALRTGPRLSENVRGAVQLVG